MSRRHTANRKDQRRADRQAERDAAGWVCGECGSTTTLVAPVGVDEFGTHLFRYLRKHNDGCSAPVLYAAGLS